MPKFEELRSTQKGVIGENIVRSTLEAQGAVVYAPLTKGPHSFDFLVDHKGSLRRVEVKTKETMVKWPVTGFAMRVHEKYLRELEAKGELWLYFVDALYCAIWESKFSEIAKLMERRNSQKDGLMAVYPVIHMGVLRSLTAGEVAQLKLASDVDEKYTRDKTSTQVESQAVHA